jgi:hypothetical protein
MCVCVCYVLIGSFLFLNSFCNVWFFFVRFLHVTTLHTQTSITVEFKPVAGVTTYELQWKDIQQKWPDAFSNAINVGGKPKKKCQAEATDLHPGTTYCVRLVCITGGARGEPGSELIIDTEQVGCAPKGGGGCMIL